MSNNNYRKIGLIFTLIILFSLNLANPIEQKNNLNVINNNIFDNVDKNNISSEIQDSSNNIEEIGIKQEVRPEEKGTPYTSITSTKGVGNNQEIRDDLKYTESYSLSLKTTYTNSIEKDYIGDQYSVSDIGYNQDSIEYQINSITPITDFYEIEAHTDYTLNKKLSLDDNRLYAQGFEVIWDYANFTRAGLYLYKDGAAGSIDIINIYIVPEGSDSKPNITNILTSTGNISINTLPSATFSGSQLVRLPTYDFTDITLSKGNYYAVVDLVETNENETIHAVWYANDTNAGGYPTYRSAENTEGTVFWSSYPSAFDFTLEVELLPVNSTGQVLEITDPKFIDLSDNGIRINSTNEKITGNFAGTHKITSNTSVPLM
ncbi:MAG: hypothetical protein ACTSPJ_01605 [Candidatus Heimdallarchaeaceae archaeon]